MVAIKQVTVPYYRLCSSGTVLLSPALTKLVHSIVRWFVLKHKHHSLVSPIGRVSAGVHAKSHDGVSPRSRAVHIANVLVDISGGTSPHFVPIGNREIVAQSSSSPDGSLFEQAASLLDQAP